MRIIISFSLLFFSFCYRSLAEEPVRLGALLHITGEFAVQGDAFKEGAQLAAAEINRTGGIGGIKLELIFEDTQYRPLMAHTGAKKLINVDKVKGAIVSTMSEIEVAGPEFEKGKIPAIVLWDSSKEIEEIGDYIFAVGPWTVSSGEVPARFSQQKFKAKSAVIMNSNTAWSLAVSQAFQAEFEKRDGKILQIFSFNPGETDFRTFIARAKALKPDVLYAPVDAELISFYSQLKIFDFDRPVVTSDIITDDLLIEGAKAFEGVYQSMTADPSSPATVKMLAAYKRHFKKDCTQIIYVAWAYDAINLLAKVGAQSKFDSRLMARSLYKIKNYPGASGSITFNARGSSPSFPAMFRVVNGKLLKLN